MGGFHAVEYHERKTIRLTGYDYAQAGCYFVTVCTQNKANLFGRIDTIGSDVVLNDAGKLIDMMYLNIRNEFRNVELHEHIVMPNHIHGIIQINPHPDFKTALTNILQSFKRSTTLKYIEGVKKGIFEPFKDKVWQRGYYDRIIRNDDELLKVQQYIIDNPVKWCNDEYYT